MHFTIYQRKCVVGGSVAALQADLEKSIEDGDTMEILRSVDGRIEYTPCEMARISTGFRGQGTEPIAIARIEFRPQLEHVLACYSLRLSVSGTCLILTGSVVPAVVLFLAVLTSIPQWRRGEFSVQNTLGPPVIGGAWCAAIWYLRRSVLNPMLKLSRYFTERCERHGH